MHVVIFMYFSEQYNWTQLRRNLSIVVSHSVSVFVPVDGLCCFSYLI